MVGQPWVSKTIPDNEEETERWLDNPGYRKRYPAMSAEQTKSLAYKQREEAAGTYEGDLPYASDYTKPKDIK